MSVLAIDTSSDRLGVAVVDEARVLASYAVLAERPHAAELPQALTRVLDASGQTFAELEGVALDIGPGSFTGLRIGLAFVKALLFHTERPLVAVPSLDVLAANARYATEAICPIVDAKQRKLYAGLFHAEQGRLRRDADYLLASVDDVVAMLRERLRLDERVIFLGDGVGRYGEAIASALGSRAVLATPDVWLPDAAALGRLGLERLRQGARDNPRDLVPMYLHPMDCSIRPSSRPPSAPRHASKPS